MAEKKLNFVGNAKIIEKNGDTFGNLKIELSQLCECLGIEYNSLKRLIAKDFSLETKQFTVPHLFAWKTDSGKSGTTLKLKIGQKKEADKFNTHWIALDDFVPESKKNEPENVENETDDMPF